MNIKDITPDQVVYFTWGTFEFNATIVWTWGVMALLVLVALVAGLGVRKTLVPGRYQSVLEAIVSTMRSQIREISGQEPSLYLPFIGTLFLFIATSNILAALAPGFTPPTASLSTTAALALLVFLAVYVFGIADQGILGYLRLYIKPTPFMLPFNIMSELSRTLALAVRLFGNMMSGEKIVAILLALTPLLFPVFMRLLGLVTGLIQAYIFAVLAMVYIAGATRAQQEKQQQLK